MAGLLVARPRCSLSCSSTKYSLCPARRRSLLPAHFSIVSSAHVHLDRSTTNGGGNFTNAPIDTKSAAFMSIGMYDATHGVAGGLGFFGLPCGAVTSNGTWSTIHDGKYVSLSLSLSLALSRRRAADVLACAA